MIKFFKCASFVLSIAQKPSVYILVVYVVYMNTLLYHRLVSDNPDVHRMSKNWVVKIFTLISKDILRNKKTVTVQKT